MRLNLKELSRRVNEQQSTIKISDRLPWQITQPCEVNVSYRVESYHNDYLLHYSVKTDLDLRCMRCSKEFKQLYQNELTLLVCRSDERAEALSNDHECIVDPEYVVDLREVITDELHLYAPEFHADLEGCTIDFV